MLQGNIRRMVFNASGNALTGQEKPVRNTMISDINTNIIIECSAFLNIADMDIPKNMVDNANGTIKASTLSSSVFEGKLNQWCTHTKPNKLLPSVMMR